MADHFGVANPTKADHLIEDRRFWLRSENEIEGQVAEGNAKPAGIEFRGPFPGLATHFRVENQGDENATIEFFGVFDLTVKKLLIDVNVGSIQEVESDAPDSTEVSLGSKTVVPLGKDFLTVDFPNLGPNDRAPDSIRFRLTAGDGPVLVEHRSGLI